MRGTDQKREIKEVVKECSQIQY